MDPRAQLTCVLAIAATIIVLVQGRNDTACIRQSGRYVLCVRTRFINPSNPLPKIKEKYSLKPPTTGFTSSSEGFDTESLGFEDTLRHNFGRFNNTGSNGLKLQNGTTLAHGTLPTFTHSGSANGHPTNTNATSNTTNPSGLLDTIIGSFGRRPFPSTSSSTFDTSKSLNSHHDGLDHGFFDGPLSHTNLGDEKKPKGGSSSSAGDEGPHFIPSTDFDLPSERFPPFDFEPFPSREFGSRRVECPPEIGGKARQGPKLTPKVIKGGKPVYVDSDPDKEVENPLVQIPIPDEGFNCVLVSVDYEHVTRKNRKKGRNANLMVEFRKSYYGDQDCYNFVDF